MPIHSSMKVLLSGIVAATVITLVSAVMVMRQVERAHNSVSQYLCTISWIASLTYAANPSVDTVESSSSYSTGLLLDFRWCRVVWSPHRRIQLITEQTSLFWNILPCSCHLVEVHHRMFSAYMSFLSIASLMTFQSNHHVLYPPCRIEIITV